MRSNINQDMQTPRGKHAFWAEHYFQIYYSLEQMDLSLKKGFEVFLFTKRRNNLQIVELDSRIKVLFIDDFESKMGGLLDTFYKKYFTPINFSKTYYRKYFKSKPSKFFLYFNSLFSVKRDINKRYVRYATFLKKINLVRSLPINFDELHIYTKVHYSYIIASYSDRTISHMESWDHPQKGPYFFNSKKHFTWNEGLKKDTEQFQDNIGEVKVEKIHKFNYLSKTFQISDSLNQKYIEEINWLKQNKQNYIVYPVCLSSSYHEIQKFETDFIKQLSEVLQPSNITLYVRPYPLAPKTDLECLKGIENIRIGLINNLTDGSEVFDKAFLAHKIEVIKNAFSILNVGTTFVLDCAYFPVPIFQFNLSSEFGRFSEVSNYAHIKSFLNKDVEVISASDYGMILHKILDRDMGYNLKLKKFLKIDDLSRFSNIC